VYSSWLRTTQRWRERLFAVLKFVFAGGVESDWGNGTYPYGMGRAREDKDIAQELARELANIAAQLGSLKGEANAWLSDERYDSLRHRLEDAHAAVEAAAVEARRRVRLNEGR
jgi:hypothetical protein